MIADSYAMSLILRYMRVDDIHHVTDIDRLCFQPPWSKDSYAFEINESRISHMVVLESQHDSSTMMEPYEDGWLQRLSGWLRQEGPAAVATGTIVGYGGLWKIEGEAHISTIATHPAHRGRGYGELLLAGMFRKALRLGAEYLVLEVRVSNAVAQSLYQKYGFSRYGRKRNYYRSDKEDAYDMRVQLDQSARRRLERLYQGLQETSHFRDVFSGVKHRRVQ